jgi:hypothetical protein
LRENRIKEDRINETILYIFGDYLQNMLLSVYMIICHPLLPGIICEPITCLAGHVKRPHFSETQLCGKEKRKYMTHQDKQHEHAFTHEDRRLFSDRQQCGKKSTGPQGLPHSESPIKDVLPTLIARFASLGHRRKLLGGTPL